MCNITFWKDDEFHEDMSKQISIKIPSISFDVCPDTESEELDDEDCSGAIDDVSTLESSSNSTVIKE